MPDSFLPFPIGKPPVDPLPILMNLLRAGCEIITGPCDDRKCFYCRCDPDYESHDSNCPWFEATTLFGDPTQKGSPQGILKA